MKMITEIKELGSKKIFLTVFLILLASLIAYSTSLSNGFIFDDGYNIVNNNFIKHLKFIPAAFFQPYLENYYRPLAMISFSFDYFFWKLNAGGYHLSNILWHGGNAILFFVLLYVLFKNFELSVISSLLFAIHPLNSFVVNYINERGNILAGFFILSTVIAFYFAYRKQSRLIYLIGFLLMLGSLLCRENAVLIPLYLACVFLVVVRKEHFKPILMTIISTLLISLIYLLLRKNYLPLPSTIKLLPDALAYFSRENIAAFFFIILNYFSSSIVYFNRGMYREITPLDLNFSPILYIILIGILTGLLIVKFIKDKPMLFALSWVLVGVFPAYNLMLSRPTVGLVMHDNCIYLSSIGLFIIIGKALLFLKRYICPALYTVLLLVIFLFYINDTLANNALYVDTEKYALHWLNKSPHNKDANLALAIYYSGAKNYNRADYHYKKILELPGRKGSNKSSVYFNNLGTHGYETGDFEKAIMHYKTAIKINPNFANPYFNLGNVYLKKNNIDLAIAYYNKTIAKDPYHFDAHYNLAIIYSRLGNKEKALKAAEIALTLDPACFNTR